MSNPKKRPLINHPCVASALVAMSGGIGSAHAIELGEIQVQSYLGQPLRASIAYALAPNEQLSDYCVSVSAASSGLPSISNTSVSVRDGVITLTGTQALREPMVSARVTIDCPYTPNLSREYLMFLDPAGFEATRNNTVVTPQAATTPLDAVARQPSGSVATRTQARPTALQQGERYRVQAGESLSEIVQRIEDRKLSLWPAVNAVFAANPDAFLDDDPNRLKAGSWLVIPTLVSDAAVAAATAPEPVIAAEPESTAATESAAETAAISPTNLNDLVTTPAEAVAPQTTAVAVEESNPYVAANQELIIPDTRIESPEQTPAFGSANAPNGNVARLVEPVGTATSFPPALLWLIGGIGLIAALLLFRRRFRGDAGDAVPQADSALARTAEIRADDFGLDDDSPTDRNLALDAAIVVSRDMNHGIDVDFTEAFDGRAELDLDLDLDEVDRDRSDRTDIIPPPQVESASILEEEVLPDADDYDMSMVVDVTKMPDPHDVTARDLQAFELSADGDDEYTVNTQAGLEILEQDYQDELSATQALNLEIERAAQQLADQLADDDDTLEQTANVHVGDISAMSVSRSDSALNEASVATGENPAIGDEDPTGTNELLDATGIDDETAVLQRDEDTTQLPLDEKTAQLRRTVEDDETVEVMTSDGDHTVEIITRDDDDATVEMEIEGGRVNTRNG